MVRLNRIYTGVGDKGKTRLGDNSEVAKNHARVEAYGSVDELNAVLALVLCCSELKEFSRTLLSRIQNELFDLGADLCTPQPADEEPGSHLRLASAAVKVLESNIDTVNKDLPALNSFLLPGGGECAARLHHARTVCRRTERRLQDLLTQDSTVNSQIGIYLNRLSDLLFVLARDAAEKGGETLWVPGGRR